MTNQRQDIENNPKILKLQAQKVLEVAKQMEAKKRAKGHRYQKTGPKTWFLMK